MAAAESAGERYTVRSVARALLILEDLATAPDQGRSVTEIADSSGLSKSAAFAVLQTMVAMNFVADSGHGQNRRYHLGMALARLGDAARDKVSVRSAAHPVLRELSTELGASVRLGVLDGDHVSVVDRVDASSGVRIDLRMGNAELLHSTALGKAIMAGLSDADSKSLLGKKPLVRRTPNTLTSVRAVLSDLDAVRKRGYAIDDEEDFEGVLCIGAAIRDSTGRSVAALSITTLKAQANAKWVRKAGEAFAVAARQISSRLGYVDEGARTTGSVDGHRRMAKVGK